MYRIQSQFQPYSIEGQISNTRENLSSPEIPYTANSLYSRHCRELELLALARVREESTLTLRTPCYNGHSDKTDSS